MTVSAIEIFPQCVEDKKDYQAIGGISMDTPEYAS